MYTFLVNGNTPFNWAMLTVINSTWDVLIAWRQTFSVWFLLITKSSCIVNPTTQQEKMGWVWQVLIWIVQTNGWSSDRYARFSGRAWSYSIEMKMKKVQFNLLDVKHVMSHWTNEGNLMSNELCCLIPKTEERYKEAFRKIDEIWKQSIHKPRLPKLYRTDWKNIRRTVLWRNQKTHAGSTN